MEISSPKQDQKPLHSLLSTIDGQDTFTLLYDTASGLVDALTFNTSEWFQNGDGFQGYWQGEQQGLNVETLPIFDVQSKPLITPLPSQDWPTILATPMPRDTDLAGWRDGGFTPAPDHSQPQILSTPIPSQQDLYRGMILERNKVSSVKARLKEQLLPTEGKIRFVPPRGYDASAPIPKMGSIGFKDRFDNIWIKGPSRTNGEDFEWDVQLSRQGQKQLGWASWASKDQKHLNISQKGKITHK